MSPVQIWSGPPNYKMAKKEEKKEESKQSVQVNLRIRDGEQFYSNESSINFNPAEIALDFKCITHTHDLGDRKGLILKHNIVLLNPFHAKNFLNMLAKVVRDYEAKFGEIKKPDSIKKAETLVKKEEKKRKENVKKDAESYFG